MFSTGKYSRFNTLFFIILLFSLNNIVYANTSLHTVTNGVVQTITSLASEVSTTVQTNKSIQITVSNNATPELSWSAEFIAPFNKQMQVSNYENAGIPVGYPQSVKSPTKPGMIVLVGVQQCATLTGRFDVLEAVYDSTGYIQQLAIDFVQTCQDSTNTITTSITGALRYNSNLALKTLKPIAIAGADQHVAEANIIDLTTAPINFSSNQILLSALNSSAGDGATINQYSWQQISGPTVTLSDTASATPNFSLPTIQLAGDELVFELIVTNSNTIVDKDQVTIFVSSKSAAQTGFFFQSDIGDYISSGQKLYSDVDDAIIILDSPGMDHAHLQVDNGLNWRADFGVSTDQSLVEGPYSNVNRHIPNTAATSPVLHIKNSKRACITVSGNFDVIQLIRDTNNKIKNLKIDFVQHCDKNLPALSGFIKYNYIDIKVPTANAGVTQDVTEGDQIALDASRSTSPVKGSINYRWSQMSGTAVTLSDSTVFNPNFLVPKPTSGTNEVLTFKLLFTNSENFISEDTVSINIKSKAAKPAPNNPSVGGGGGGSCSINANAELDVSFYLLLLLALLVPFYRKVSNQNLRSS